jgi:hypothetical protein
MPMLTSESLIFANTLGYRDQRNGGYQEHQRHHRSLHRRCKTILFNQLSFSKELYRSDIKNATVARRTLVVNMQQSPFALLELEILTSRKAFRGRSVAASSRLL